MRLLVDLIGCQTPSRLRGIGRYTLGLTGALARSRGDNEMFCMADPLLPQSYEELRQEFIRCLPAGHFLPYFHEPIPENDPNEDKYRQLASSLICQARQAVSPDLVLTPSVFEVWGTPQVVVPLPDGKKRSYKQVAILYDLIPYIFRDRYLDSNPAYGKWYLERFNSLKNFDLLLAISEATRQDAIRILDLPPEKVVNISSAVGEQFQKMVVCETEKRELFQRLGINRPFVFYLGNDDFRKNLEGAVEIFSNLPSDLIRTHQLLLNNVYDETVIRNKIRSVGLTEQDVVICKRISDDDVLKLYNLCAAFIFPSLYEGFGLPVLEAMACGAPVLAANNSSLPEVVGRDDLLFDAKDPKQAASILARILTNAELREELSIYGLERAKQFSWEKSARLAWQSMQSIQRENVRNQIFSSVQIKTNRSRIAFVSPLPPQQSGISDYSAELLPYLAKHFNIDLFVDSGLESSSDPRLQTFHAHPWTELLKHRDDYATVVYQFGNSPFHSHMFELVKKFPGVVVLHDFFLSAVLAHLHNTIGDFSQILDKNHGLRSLVNLQSKESNIIRDWPLNWQVLRQTKEVIVHSAFQKYLLDKYYQPGWQPQLNVIPQLRTIEPEITPKVKILAREQLHLPLDSFVICSFGHMDEIKLNHLIIQALSIAQVTCKRDCQLVFVGSCYNSKYHNQIDNLITELKLSNKVHITGFVEESVYKRYLMAADIAIQLRQLSRGETSRAVLDCMAYGLPVILNAHGTLNDYSDEDVIKIEDPVNLQELAQAMVRLEADESYGADKAAHARNRIKTSHNPESIVVAYTEVIERAIKADDRVILKPAANALANMNVPTGLVEAQARFAAQNIKVRNRPRILIDVGPTLRYDLRTGIQRVVKRIVQELFNVPSPSPQIEPVYIFGSELRRASRFLEKILDLPLNSLGVEQTITICPGDILVMMDLNLEEYDKFAQVFYNIRSLGGKIVTVVYDLIPIDFPQLFPELLPVAFRRWLNSACAESDILLCISKTVAKAVSGYRLNNKIGLDRQLDITYFHLGADIPAVSNETSVREEVTALLKRSKSPLFMIVGTIEPRKGHAFTLDAFELLWAQGDQSLLVFAGKIRFDMSEMEARIRNHPQLNKLFFFIENPTDAELEVLYSEATALIAASTAEGFGLPIVEAALHGVTTLASDIPVFHEVGGEGALYFSLESPRNLAEVVVKMESLTKEERLAMARRVKVLTWKQSAERFLEILQNKRPS